MLSPANTVNIQAVLFDLDGTLIDTEPSAAHALERCFHKWGITVAADDARFVTGRTWESAFQFLFDKYPLPVSREQAATEILEAYRLSLETELVIVPGSVDAVRSLAETYPLALVSGSHRREILWALKKLGIQEHFQWILGAEDYPRSKPSPDGYLSALEKMQKLAKDALVFEDSTAGITSGRAAGAWVVAITSTNHFNQDTSLAHHHLTNLTSVTAEWVKTTAEKLLFRHPFTRES